MFLTRTFLFFLLRFFSLFQILEEKVDKLLSFIVCGFHVFDHVFSHLVLVSLNSINKVTSEAEAEVTVIAHFAPCMLEWNYDCFLIFCREVNLITLWGLYLKHFNFIFFDNSLSFFENFTEKFRLLMSNSFISNVFIFNFDLVRNYVFIWSRHRISVRIWSV